MPECQRMLGRCCVQIGDTGQRNLETHKLRLENKNATKERVFENNNSGKSTRQDDIYRYTHKGIIT